MFFFNNSSCHLCGEDGNYTKCDYRNLLCEEGENYFTSEFRTYKDNYMNFFKNETNHESFCGNQTPTINYDKTETIMIKIGNNYTKGTKAHCFYRFELEQYYRKLNPKLIIEIIKGKNKLQFDLITVIIKKEYYYTYTYLDLYTDEDIRNSSETINLTDYESVELYLDFKEYLYSQIDESLQIKIKLDKNSQNKDSSDLATILGSTLSTILD